MNTKTDKQAAKQQVNTTATAKFDGIQASPAKVALVSGVATLLSPGSTTTVGYEIGHEPEQAELLIRLTGSSGGGSLLQGVVRSGTSRRSAKRATTGQGIYLGPVQGDLALQGQQQ
ncbi:hypothetical protein [Aeromonas veronii]|uniref:hypothetical protein n=1 Tax=Aeromonas veronii TaxID=654 RepID=UPI0024448AF4|nr:hypothetical protein [Aeromonas veronii]